MSLLVSHTVILLVTVVVEGPDKLRVFKGGNGQGRAESLSFQCNAVLGPQDGQEQVFAKSGT